MRLLKILFLAIIILIVGKRNVLLAQTKYPKLKKIDGIEIVLITKAHADEINRTIERQNSRINYLQNRLDSLENVNEQKDEWIDYTLNIVDEYESTMKKYSKIIDNYERKIMTIFYWDDITQKMDIYSTIDFIVYRNRKGKLMIKRRW